MLGRRKQYRGGADQKTQEICKGESDRIKRREREEKRTLRNLDMVLEGREEREANEDKKWKDRQGAN